MVRIVHAVVAICVMGAVMKGSSAPQSGGAKAVKAGKLIDSSGRVMTNAVIVIDNDRIASVGTGPVPADTQVIDLSRYAIVPGLIDAHTHMTYFWDPASGGRPGPSAPRRARSRSGCTSGG